MKLKILFSESESYYRDLGLVDDEKFIFCFDGMLYYNKNCIFLKSFNLFVCLFYTLPHNTILTEKFKLLGIKTLLCSDGVFDFSNSFYNPMVTKYKVNLFFPVLQDYFLCVGKKEKDFFQVFSNTITYTPKRMMSEFEYIPLPSETKVLITTANSAYFSMDEFCRLKELLVGVSKCLITDNISFSFRIFDQKLLSEVKSELPCTIENDIQESFESILLNYSSVVTTPSSISVTAMYHQRAVATLLYRDTPLFLNSGWSIPSVAVFKSCLLDFTGLDSERMAIQNRLLSQHLSDSTLNKCITDVLDHDFINTFSKTQCVNQNMLNMLDSKFNFNFEWFIRKIYLRIRSLPFIRKIKLWIK